MYNQNDGIEVINCPNNCYNGKEISMVSGNRAFHTLTLCPVCNGKGNVHKKHIDKTKHEWGL